jgi:putative spermidine/putrescine transport system permease protein
LSRRSQACSALAIARSQFPGRDAIVALLTMPLAVPHVVLALALLQILAIVRVPTAPWGLMAGHILITMPYVLRLTLTSLHDLDHTIERASYSLGATPWQTFRLVTLPMIAPGVIAGVFFAFLLSFDEVTISIFLSQPGQTTLPSQIFGIASHGSDPIITAASGLLIIVATILVLLIERYFGALRLIVGGKTR